MWHHDFGQEMTNTADGPINRNLNLAFLTHRKGQASAYPLVLLVRGIEEFGYGIAVNEHGVDGVKQVCVLAAFTGLSDEAFDTPGDALGNQNAFVIQLNRKQIAHVSCADFVVDKLTGCLANGCRCAFG